jgi:hypothetical protein
MFMVLSSPPGNLPDNVEPDIDQVEGMKEADAVSWMRAKH